MSSRSAAYWVSVVKAIKRDGTHGQRAPYKALLLLWMIARATNGASVSVAFREAEPALIEFMRGHVLGNKLRVQYPFVYLASSRELWEVRDSHGKDVYAMKEPIPSRQRHLQGRLDHF